MAYCLGMCVIKSVTLFHIWTIPRGADLARVPMLSCLSDVMSGEMYGQCNAMLRPRRSGSFRENTASSENKFKYPHNSHPYEIQRLRFNHTANWVHFHVTSLAPGQRVSRSPIRRLLASILVPRAYSLLAANAPGVRFSW
jgi:hypothetical protein